MRMLLAATTLALAFGAAEAVKSWTGPSMQATIQTQEGQSTLALASGD